MPDPAGAFRAYETLRKPRTRAIALWVGTGSALSAMGTMLSGFLLQYFVVKNFYEDRKSVV